MQAAAGEANEAAAGSCGLISSNLVDFMSNSMKGVKYGPLLAKESQLLEVFI